MTQADTSKFNIKRGKCFALYAHDIGFAIDLKACRKKLTSVTQPDLQAPRRDPRAFDCDSKPISIPSAGQPIHLGRYTTDPTAEVLIYEFGAVLVNFTIPLSGPFDSLSALTRELVDNPLLLEQSRKRIEELLPSIKSCIVKPHVSAVVEDYVILRVDEFESSMQPVEIPVRMAETLARVLRAEDDELSEQEIADAMACRISYGTADVTVVDWNAALVIDKDADDVQSVLESANIELLEMRFLDHKLDNWLDEAHEISTRPLRTRFRHRAGSRRSMRRVAEMQMDGAILFERVSNAPKLLGDQYLARLYRLASQRFHLSEWNSSILRKLDVIESIYEKLSDRAANKRMEMLDWIIIILILAEIVLALWPQMR